MKHGRTSGLSLVEVMISTAILSILALAIMAATIPLSDASAEHGAALDMDRQAGKFMIELRRELRQSGFQSNGTCMVTSPSPGPASALTFRRREGPLDTVGANGWSSDAITYQRVASSPSTYSGISGTPARYKIQRSQSGLTFDVIDDVADVSFERPTNSRTVLVTLTLTRPDPNWRGRSTPPPAIVRVYRDTIELMNRGNQ